MNKIIEDIATYTGCVVKDNNKKWKLHTFIPE